jgi:hypothetical protein
VKSRGLFNRCVAEWNRWRAHRLAWSAPEVREPVRRLPPPAWNPITERWTQPGVWALPPVRLPKPIQLPGEDLMADVKTPLTRRS